MSRRIDKIWNSDIRIGKKLKIFGKTCDIQIWMGHLEVLPKGLSVAILGTRGLGFGVGRRGSR